MRGSRNTLGVLIALSLAVVACGGGDDDDSGGSAATEPVATEPTDAATGDTGTSPDTRPPATDAAGTEPAGSTPVDSAPVGSGPVGSDEDAVESVESVESVAPGTWTAVPGGPDCVCADGSEVEFFVREADPTKVVFYFEGGGACFSAETCAFDSGTYVSTADVSADGLEARGGIFDESNPDNPLADHSWVYVPYCTGDVHLGDATTDYSDTLSVRHNGYVNGLAALDTLVTTFPDAEELFVTGASAGSVPTPLFAGLLSDELPGARIITVGDSSGAYPDVPALNVVIGDLWGARSAIPDWPETQDVDPEDWSIPGLYSFAGLHDPDITFAKFDYAYDDVQAFFGGLAGVPATDLLSLIDDIEAEIEATGVDIASYIAPGTAHTIVGGDDFYDLTVDGVAFVDWVSALVAGDEVADVRCTDCR